MVCRDEYCVITARRKDGTSYDYLDTSRSKVPRDLKPTYASTMHVHNGKRVIECRLWTTVCTDT